MSALVRRAYGGAGYLCRVATTHQSCGNDTRPEIENRFGVPPGANRMPSFRAMAAKLHQGVYAQR